MPKVIDPGSFPLEQDLAPVGMSFFLEWQEKHSGVPMKWSSKLVG